MITLSDLSSLVPEIVAETTIKFNRNVGVMDAMVVKDVSGQKGNKVTFPVASQIGSGDVRDTSEEAVTGTVTDITITDVEATLAKKQIRFKVSDEAVEDVDLDSLTGADSLVKLLSDLGADATKAKLEKDVTLLFPSFTTTIAGAGVTLASTHFDQALNALQGYNALGEYYAGLAPKQIRGGKGIADFLVGASVNNNFGATGLPKELLEKGFIDVFNTFKVLQSNQVNTDYGGLGDASGGLWSKNAIGFGHKGIATMEVNRLPGIGFDIILTSRWKAVLINADWGCHLLSDVA